MKALLRLCCSPRGETSAKETPVADARVTPEHHFFLAPYGILGQRLDRARQMVKMAEPPRDNIAFVDPAGLPYIQQHGPAGAAGAAGAIYGYLGIRNDRAFPAEVRQAITTPMLAKHHRYPLADGGHVDCVHVVGPDCRGLPVSARSDAVEQLANAYTNVLAEFAACAEARTLRLLPISGGIFAGAFEPEIAQLTMAATQRACESLPAAVHTTLLQRRVEMCIFAEADLEAFAKAGFKRPGSMCETAVA